MVRKSILGAAIAAIVAVVAGVVYLPGVFHGREPKIRTLSEREILDMMLGSSIQASRGVDTARATQQIRTAIRSGKKFTMISVDDVPEDWTTVSVGGVGGGGAWDYVRERARTRAMPTVQNIGLLAVQALSRHLGKKFNAVVRSESAQTASALMLGAELGLPVVDACLSGRARPEIEQQIPWINGIPSTPAALVTRWGDTIILEKTVDDYRVEDLARGVAVASGGGTQIAMNPMSGKAMKRGVVNGALSQAILFGRTARQAVEDGKDPVAALVKITDGFMLFRGTVTKAEMKGERGFAWWDVEIDGAGPYAGHLYKIYVKNENIVAWLDGVPDAMSPDTIQNLDPKTGDALGSSSLGGYKLGADVAMIGYNTSQMWRSEKGIEVLGPRHFGFDFDYVPIEELQRLRRVAIR